MNKVGLLLGQLHDAEPHLAAEYRAVAERQAAEHDLSYLGHSPATQCDQRAEAVRTIAQRFSKDLSESSSPEALAQGIRLGPATCLGRCRRS